jgi:hypothetical protein
VKDDFKMLAILGARGRSPMIKFSTGFEPWIPNVVFLLHLERG